MKKQKISLSIAICSTRPVNTLALLCSLLYQIEDEDQVIIIFDIEVDNSIKNIFFSLSLHNSIEIKYNYRNRGLSYGRNYCIDVARNKFLVFFDDDVLLPNNIIDLYKAAFSKDFSVVGGPLKLPDCYASLPKWLPTGYSYLLGIHTFQRRIWGANFGFERHPAIKNRIYFKSELGRKDGKLQSGDETDFFERYCKIKNSYQFIDELFVYHCIDYKRFNVFYFLKRAFWQGKSECKKKTIILGLKKEFTRAQTISNHKFMLRIYQRMIGLVFFIAFLSGILCELIMLGLRFMLKTN